MKPCFAVRISTGAGKFVFWAVLLLFIPGTSAFAAEQDDQGAVSVDAVPADDEYIIGIGDILSIQVWREPELSTMLTVRTDGRISLPLVGDVQVAGRSINSLTSFLSREFSKVITEPAVSVTLVENRSKRYYLVGQIQQPGEFPIDQPITVLQAIARGGGFLEWAKRDRIAIIRRTEGREERIPFDYDAYVRGKNQDQSNIMISPGDTIIVP